MKLFTSFGTIFDIKKTGSELVIDAYGTIERYKLVFAKDIYSVLKEEEFLTCDENFNTKMKHRVLNYDTFIDFDVSTEENMSNSKTWAKWGISGNMTLLGMFTDNNFVLYERVEK